MRVGQLGRIGVREVREDALDFDVAGRESVIDYVRGKYGADRVCQISTFGTLGAKASQVIDLTGPEARVVRE